MQRIAPLKTRLQAAATFTSWTRTSPLSSTRSYTTSITHNPNPENSNDLVLERTILNPEHDETCKSGTDDEVGRHKSPYDPAHTRPEREHLALEEEYKLEGNMTHDPLFVSPANVACSQVLDPMIGGAVHNAQTLGSVRGWTNKHKVVLLRRSPFVFRRYENVVWRFRSPFFPRFVV